MQLHHVLYRDLLAIARELDRNAGFRALLSSNMLVRPEVGSKLHKTRLPHADVFNRHLLEFLDHRAYYLPANDRKSAQAIVRAQFRHAAASTRELDTAFVALKALNERWAFAARVGVLDAAQRKSRATADVEHAHTSIAQALRDEAVESSRAAAIHVQLAEQVQTGVFLLSHPLLNGIFRRAVVLVTEHATTKGTRGFIVNRPTKTPLVKAFKVHPRIAKTFGETKVRRGGPLRTDYAEIFHTRAELGGRRVLHTNFRARADAQDDLFQGVELDVAAEAVEGRKLQPADLVFINGVSSWTPGQLDGELARGTWVAVRAPLSVAIDARKDLWRELMAKLGGEYEAFSRMPEVDDSGEFDDDDEDEEDDIDHEFVYDDEDDDGEKDDDEEDEPHQ